MIKRYNKHILAAAMLLTGGTAVAQNLNSGYFTDQYIFRHEMNPAIDNEQNYVSIPGLGNINVSAHGNFGYGDVVMPNPLYPGQSENKTTTFMNPYISDSKALEGFSKGNNRIAADVNINLLSVGFKGFKGYNTIEINSKTNLGVSLPYELFAFARNIGNNSYNIGDIKTHAQSYAELAFGHSHKINNHLKVGGKLKFLFGLGRVDLEMNDVRADFAGQDRWTVSGNALSQVSVMGFQYKTVKKDYKVDGVGEYDKIDDVDIDGYGLSGFGMAVDLGAVYKINDSWTVSASLLDLGFISWKNNFEATNRSKSFEFNGFHDVAVKEEHGEVIGDKADKYSDQISDFINLRSNGDSGSRTTGIGATFNAACEYTLPTYKKVSFGLLSTTRINGAYSWTEGRLSANWRPLKWLDGGVSFAANSFTTSMGWNLNIHPKGYNFYIGMDHILGKMSNDYIPLNTNASLMVGMSIAW